MNGSTNYLRKRTRGTFLTSLFSISLVLFFLALTVTAALYGNRLLIQVQEEFEMMILITDETSEPQLKKVENFLEKQPYVKEMRFISKEEAAKDYSESLGEDFMEIMDGINPLRASFNVKLNADYISTDSINKVNAGLAGFAEVAEVEYPIEQIERIRKNTKNILAGAAGVSIIVIFLAYFLISGTVRLAIFSKRLVIRSMQLIGATAGFIRAPFIKMGVLQGIVGALLADLILCGLLFGAGFVWEEFGDFKSFLITPEFMLLLGGIVIFGSILGWLSSRFAVNRYLNKNLDELI